MVDLPKKKVGIIACAGEEIPEGTVSRVAARIVLEELSPEDTVTLCLPLFLAGDENERAFARFYPTVAIDGCEKLCAKRATEKYSGPVSGSIVVDKLLEKRGLSSGKSRRQLDEDGERAVAVVAAEIAHEVGRLLGRQTVAKPAAQTAEAAVAGAATCGCGPGIPITQLKIGGVPVGLMALEPIFEQLYQQGKRDGEGLGDEILKGVKLYNYVPASAEESYKATLLEEYQRFCENKG